MKKLRETSKVVCWRLSRMCNRSCDFCLSLSGPKVNDVREIGLSDVDRLEELGVEKISYAGGEPLLLPEFQKIVEHAERLQLRQILTTNGDRLLKCTPSCCGYMEYIKVSIYGTQEIHDSIMGQGHYKSLLGAIKRMAIKEGIVVGVNVMLSRKAVATFHILLQELEVNGVDRIFGLTYNGTGNVNVDMKYQVDDPSYLCDIIQEQVLLSACTFAGGVKVHDYGVTGYYVVLNEEGNFTLPSGVAGKDVVIGSLWAPNLRFPNVGVLPSPYALDLIWNRRSSTSAVWRIQPPAN